MVETTFYRTYKRSQQGVTAYGDEQGSTSGGCKDIPCCVKILLHWRIEGVVRVRTPLWSNQRPMTQFQVARGAVSINYKINARGAARDEHSPDPLEGARCTSPNLTIAFGRS